MAAVQKLTITKSVGKTGSNRPPDVYIVQRLLNMARENYPAFKSNYPEEVPEDGVCETMTMEAIGAFQHYGLRWMKSSSDSRVDVNGKTWKALNGNVDLLVQIRSMTTIETLRTFEAFRQGDFKENLGFGSRTISEWGCVMCCLTMAATAIGARTTYWSDYPNLPPEKLTPSIVNAILKKAGCFGAGQSTLSIGPAAMALGMLPDGPFRSSTNVIGVVNNHLAQGLPLLLHVDYKHSPVMVPNPQYVAGSTVPAEKPKEIPKRDAAGNIIWKNTYEGDHWVLLVARSGNSYTALDPSYGATVRFTSDVASQTGNTRLSAGDSFAQPFLVGEHGFYGRSPDDYTVRGFYLLGRG